MKKQLWISLAVLLSFSVLAEKHNNTAETPDLGPLQPGMVPDFAAEYDVYYGDYHLGAGRYELERTGLETYQFRFASKMRFLLFFSDKRWLKTDFSFRDNQIIPHYFWHKRRGTGKEYTDEITFDAKAKHIKSVHKEALFDLDYDAMVKDGLSVQLQLMLDLRRGLKQPSYKIIEQGSIDERQFAFTGEDTIEIEGIEYQCVVYEIVRDNKNRSTQMWFSPQHNYQPLMMAHYSKKEKKFNARLKYFKVNDDKAEGLMSIAVDEHEEMETINLEEDA